MASASTPSANEPTKDLSLVHTVQVKPMIKVQISGRMLSSGIRCSVHFSILRENRLKKLMILLLVTQKPFTSK